MTNDTKSTSVPQSGHVAGSGSRMSMANLRLAAQALPLPPHRPPFNVLRVLKSGSGRGVSTAAIEFRILTLGPEGG